MVLYFHALVEQQYSIIVISVMTKNLGFDEQSPRISLLLRQIHIDNFFGLFDFSQQKQYFRFQVPALS